MQTRSLLFVALFAFAACQDDLTAEKAQWDTSMKDWATRQDKIKKGHAALLEKLKSVAVPEGDATLTAEKAALDKSAASCTEAVNDIEHHVATSKGVIDGLIAKGKKVPVEVALSAEKATVDGAVAKAQSLVDATGEMVNMLNTKVAAAKASADAAKSRTEAWAGEAKKKGGMLAIDDIAFNGDALNVDKSKVALTSLVATLKACPELKVELAVTALGEAADLGSKRGEALKAYLTSNGVDAGVFAKVAGAVVKEGDEKVAVTVSTPCK
jgi:outer membrane protein OmpA-like peptidoglycan-associated protein